MAGEESGVWVQRPPTVERSGDDADPQSDKITFLAYAQGDADSQRGEQANDNPAEHAARRLGFV